MDVLQRWLNDEVGLSKHITNFEKDFANGYFFGEIFNKYNLQPDFRSFLNFHSMDSKMNNFARLEPVLRVLDAKVPSKTLNEIMEEKKGVAARVLLSVKAALENISEEDRRRANTPTSFPPLSRGSATMQQQENQNPLSSSLQNSLNSTQQFSSSPPPQRSAESAGQQSPKRHNFRTFEAESTLSATPQRLKANPPEKDQPPSLQDVKPISVKIDKHKVDLKYQQYVEEKARKKKLKQTVEATHDVMNGIESFEKSLKNFSYEDPQQAQQQQQQQQMMTNSKKPPTSSTRRVATSTPNIEGEDDEDSKKYMQKIKKKKDEEQIARQERDKRRRKILLEQQQVQKALDDKQNEEMLLEKLLRQSKEERRIAARIVETRNKAKEIRKNRIIREEQHAALRQKEFELLLEKDAQLGRAAKLDYELKAKLDRELFEQYEARRRVIKQENHYAICGRIVDYFIVEYKKLSDGQMPGKEMREWKTLFKEGVPLFPPTKQSSATTLPLTFSSYEAEDERDSILNERDFLDYLKGKEEWALSPETSPSSSIPSLPLPTPQTNPSSALLSNRPVSPSVPSSVLPSRPVTPSVSHVSHPPPPSLFNPQTLIDVPQNNKILGQIVSYLFSLSLPTDPPPLPPIMPSFPFKMVLTGKHLAGKTNILKKIGESYRVSVISVSQLVLNVIEESKNSGSPTEFTEIGFQCAQALEENKEIPDDIQVKLIVREINEIARRNEEENKGHAGWVIEGFPETAAQAQLLEKALTGYEPPPSPKAKKAKGKKKVEKNTKKRGSQIAQPPPEEAPPPPENLKSGIDIVIHVNVSDDTIIKRAVGRRIDHTTGITYHLEYNPPPEHKGVNGRLVPVETGDTTILYQKLSSFKDELPKLEKWYSRFNNFKEVNGELAIDDIIAAIEGFIQQASEENAKKGVEEEKEEKANIPLTIDSEVVTKPELFDVDLASILIEKFLDMEASYTTTAKTIFSRMRKERKTILHHLSRLRDDFLMYLKRPHTMQHFIEPFQQNFNEIENDMRRDVETKQELHQRTDDLRDKLWEISDIRKSEAEAERKSTNEDGWVEARLVGLTNMYISLMQLEVDRYDEGKHLIRDFVSGCRKVPLEDGANPPLELPLVGATSSSSNTIVASNNTVNITDDPSAKPPSRGVSGGLRKKKEGSAPSRGNSVNSLPVPSASVAPNSPKLPAKPSSSQNRRVKKKPIGEPIINRYDNEPFPDIYIAYSMAQNLVIEAEKKDESYYGLPLFEGMDVGQALQLEDKIFLSRLERIKDRGLRVLMDIKAQSEKLAAKEEDWLGKRFLREMNAISALTRLVKDTVEREKKLPYYFHLVDDEFIIEEDMLVFEPELAPPPPIPQELTYPDRFSSDQITALTQRFSLLAPWTLISVKDCADLLFSLTATSELGFEFLPFEWQDLDVAQFTKLVRAFIRVEAGTPNYIPNSTTPSSTLSNHSEFIDWREFLVFCLFSGSISPPSLLVSSASDSNKNLNNYNTSNNNNIIRSGSTTRGMQINNFSQAVNIINTDGSDSGSIATPTFVLPSISLPITPTSLNPPITSPPTSNSNSTSHIIASSPRTPTSAKRGSISSTNEEPNINDVPTVEIENTETQVEGAPNSNRTIMLLGNYVFPSPPSMTQLAEMKAAFRGVDTDNDGKVTYAEYLKVPLWFESVTSEFSSPQPKEEKEKEKEKESGPSSSEIYSFFAQKLKRAIFQSEEINFNRGSKIGRESVSTRSFYGTPKVDYMEFLAYFSVDWNEGEGIRKAMWISSDPPGRPLDLQKLVFLLHTQFATSLQNEAARQLLYTISSDTHTAVSDTASLELLLSSPTGRALVERAYDRFTLKNVKPNLRLANNVLQ